MRTHLELIEKIDAFILGELNSKEAQAMANEIKHSAELQEIYETQQLIQQAAKRKAILQQVQLFAPTVTTTSTFWTKFKWPIILSSILIAIVGISLATVLNSVDESKTGSENATGKSTVLLNQEPQPTLKVTEESDSTEATILLPFKPIQATSTTNTNKFPGGLHTWVTPEMQHFTIDPRKSNTLECNEGTLIIVPANAVIDNKGTPIINEVQIEVIEALTIDKMIAYNLTTESNGQSLTSGGMLYIQPYSNSEKVNFAKDTPCHIEVPTDNYNGDMKTWEGKIDAAGNINWENPKAIENYLIPVDFSTLDFVPKGFRPHFQAQLPFESYIKSSVALEDSFYYSLSGRISDNLKQEVNIGSSNQNPVISSEEIINTGKMKSSFGSLGKQKIVSKTATISIPDFNNKGKGNNKVQFVSDNLTLFITLNDGLYSNVELPSKKPITGSIIAKTPTCDSLVISNVTLELYKVTTILLSEGECLLRKKVEQPICYINPSSMKALRQPKFKNTFIATREFEERLQLLHTIKNAEPLLELYIQNIDKNMFEVDAMVAAKLTGTKKVIFENLATQKLTNVDLKNANLEAIQEYYNATRKQFQADARKEQEKLNNTSKAELQRLSNELSALQSEYFSNFQKTLPSGASPISARVLPKNLKIKAPKNNVARQASYKLPWYNSGWMNIDNYLHILSKGEKIILVNTNATKENQRIYQCINSLKTVIPLNNVQGNYEGHYPSAANPENSHFISTYCIGIAKTDKAISYASKIFNANQNSKIELEWKTVSEEELLEKLKALSPYNDVLAQSIIDEKKKIEEQIALKAQREALEKEFNEKKGSIVAAQNKIIEQMDKHQQFVQRLIDFIDPCCDKSANIEIRIPNNLSGGLNVQEQEISFSNVSKNISLFPDAEAKFPGGNSAMNKYISENFIYPQKALDDNLIGTIYVRMIIDVDGKILNPTISNPTQSMAILEEEAIRMVKAMPNWEPAIVNGTKISSFFELPVKCAVK